MLAQQEIISLGKQESRRFVAALLGRRRKVPQAARSAMAEYRRRVVNHL